MLDKLRATALGRRPGLGSSDDRAGGKALDSRVGPASRHEPRRRPPRPCCQRGGGLGGPKSKEAPTPMRQGPR